MITIQDLLNYLKSIDISYTGTTNTEAEVRNIEVLTESSSFSEYTLYISNSYNKLLNFISSSNDVINNINVMLISDTEIADNKICQIISSSSFEYIVKLLSKYISYDYDLSIKNNSIYNSLYTCSSMKEILNSAENLLGNPLFLVDTSYSILCRSNIAESVDTCIEKHNERYYLKFDIVNLMKKYKCIETIYNSSHAFFHHDEDNLIFCSVKINNITTSYICILEKDKKFKKDDLILAGTLSKVISAFSEKEHIFISNSGLCDEYYLIDLITNKIDNTEYIKERLAESNFKIKENFILISVPFVQKHRDYRYNFGLKELMQTGKNILKNCLSAYYENNILFLVSSDDPEVLTSSEKLKFEEFLKLNKLKCGLSFVFNDILLIHDFMLQSYAALTQGAKISSAKLLYYFEDIADYYLFSIAASSDSSNKINLESLIHPTIKMLIKYDKDNNSELFKTLKAYFQNNRNAAKCAEMLNINRSTFFYRFHKIENILNIDINSYAYKLETSIRIYSYISSTY